MTARSHSRARNRIKRLAAIRRARRKPTPKKGTTR